MRLLWLMVVAACSKSDDVAKTVVPAGSAKAPEVARVAPPPAVAQAPAAPVKVADSR